VGPVPPLLPQLPQVSQFRVFCTLSSTVAPGVGVGVGLGTGVGLGLGLEPGEAGLFDTLLLAVRLPPQEVIMTDKKRIARIDATT
jgi:hypothetical protein